MAINAIVKSGKKRFELKPASQRTYTLYRMALEHMEPLGELDQNHNAINYRALATSFVSCEGMEFWEPPDELDFYNAGAIRANYLDFVDEREANPEWIDKIVRAYIALNIDEDPDTGPAPIDKDDPDRPND